MQMQAVSYWSYCEVLCKGENNTGYKYFEEKRKPTSICQVCTCVDTLQSIRNAKMEKLEPTKKKGCMAYL